MDDTTLRRHDVTIHGSDYSQAELLLGPDVLDELHLEAGAVSRDGVRVLGAALHSAPGLRVLSLAHGGFRGSDLLPIFTLLQGGPGSPPCRSRSTACETCRRPRPNSRTPTW